jgi:hypothetical protein
MIRDRDAVYGDVLIRRLRAKGNSGSTNRAAIAVLERIL